MPQTTQPTAAAVLRSLVMPIYLPALAVQTGTAMLLPILPLYLRSIERSYSQIAVILAAAGVGAMLAQLPFGRMLAQRSEQSVMLMATAAMAVTVAVVGLVDVTALLITTRLLWGAASTGWLLSRQTLMTRVTTRQVRGRAMSLFGGTTRLGFFVGPVIGGFAVEAVGFTAAFLLAGAVTSAGALPLLSGTLAFRPGFLRNRRNDRNTKRLGGEDNSVLQTPTAPAPTLRQTLAAHWRMLAPMGIAQVLIIAVRQGRQIVLPLIGDGLGLEPGSIGLLVGIGTFTDFALFPLAGIVMDRYGRLAAVVPAFSLVGFGLLWLATVDSYAGVAAAAALIGVGNSLGSGTMLTLSSDIAPADATSQFLGTLGAIRDSGRIVGPVVVGVLADEFGLAAASTVLGVGAFVAVAIFVFGVGETSGISRRSDTRAPST